MNPTYEAMLSLLKTALWGEETFPYALPEDADMAAIKEELENQGVLTLTADVLGRRGDRDAIREAANRLTHWYTMMAEQSAALSMLEGEGIPAVVLKGAAADIYYPKPEYRKLGDIDLLIPPEMFDRAAEAFRQNGYDQYLDKPRHLGFHRGIVRFEVHRFFTEAGEQPLDERLFSAMERRQTGEILGVKFPMLPHLENGLVLLEHMAQHLHGSFGLRQIIDWMLYAKAELSDEAYPEFAAAAREFGLETLAVSVTRMCQKYLGLTEAITWSLGADDAVCNDLMALVLERGNFGVKDPDSAKAVSVLRMAKNPIKFMGQLQTMGKANWKALETKPYLTPFAWGYQACRFAGRGLGRKNALSQLRSDAKKADAQQALLKRLELL